MVMFKNMSTTANSIRHTNPKPEALMNAIQITRIIMMVVAMFRIMMVLMV